MTTFALGFVVAWWVFIVSLVCFYLSTARWESDKLEAMAGCVGPAVYIAVGAGFLVCVIKTVYEAHVYLLGGVA